MRYGYGKDLSFAMRIVFPKMEQLQQELTLQASTLSLHPLFLFCILPPLASRSTRQASHSIMNLPGPSKRSKVVDKGIIVAKTTLPFVSALAEGAIVCGPLKAATEMAKEIIDIVEVCDFRQC